MKNKLGKIIVMSLIMIITFVVSTFATETATPPTVSGFTKTGIKNEDVTFDGSDFTSHYTDTNTPEQPLERIKVSDLPSAEEGVLKLRGTPMTEGQTVVTASIHDITFTPDIDFIGEATFKWRGKNNTLFSTEAATVTITVATQILAPIASDQTLNLGKNQIKVAYLIATDPQDLDLTYSIVTQPTKGTLTLVNSATGKISYRPNTNYVGADSFTFKANNGTVDSNIATVTINVEEEEIPFYYEDMQTHWANYSASHLAALNVVVGNKYGSKYFFYPDTRMTRMDFILFLIGAGDKIKTQNKEGNVEFVDKDTFASWMLDFGKEAYKKGIISGADTNGKLSLKPNIYITRAEAAIMLNNVTGLSDNTADLTFADKKDVPSWAAQAIKNLTGYKILSGLPDNTIRPYNQVTRAEAAELLYKSIKEVEYQASLSTALKSKMR